MGTAIEDTTVKVTISLGNDAMRTGADLAAAFRKLANQIESYNEDDLVAAFDDGAKITIRDLNGNRVGALTVE